MVNYSQAKVYKIVDNTNGNIYVGSTCEPTLARRLSGHVSNYKTYLNGKGCYYTSYQILENNNYEIVLIEKCENITTRDELKARERHYIETLTCVNKVIPLRTTKERREDNRDVILKKKKEYYHANKEKILLC
jgi:predicted GIY-YIG superfamily endonuclease